MTNEHTLRSIGKLVEGSPPRDAVHIAVIAVEAGETLKPGERVAMSDGLAVSSENRAGDWHGVVDPYLYNNVAKGERFWLFLQPGSITALTHLWSHYAFPSSNSTPPDADYVASDAWLRKFADDHAIPLKDLVEHAVKGDIDDGHRDWFGTDDDAHNPLDSDFWHHIEIVTGKHYDENHRQLTVFSCTC